MVEVPTPTRWSRTKQVRLWQIKKVGDQTSAFVRRIVWAKAWVRAHNRHGMDRFEQFVPNEHDCAHAQIGNPYHKRTRLVFIA